MTGATHDHEITIGSTTKGLDLVRDEYGRAMCSEIEDIPAYRNPFVFSQSTWTGGHGQYRTGNPAMYFEGQAIDTFQEGRVIMGAYQVPTNNKVFLTGSEAYDGSEGSPYTTQLTGSRNPTAGDMTLLPATPAENDAYYFGYSAIFNKIDITITQKGAGTWTLVWEYYDTDTSWKAVSGLTDGTTSFTSATGTKTVTFTPSGTWAQVAVNSTTAYWIRARISAYTSVTTQPLAGQAWVYLTDNGGAGGQVFPTAYLQMASTPLYTCWFPTISKLMCATATQIFWWDDSYWVQKWVTTGTIHGLIVYNDILYVALGDTDSYWYSSDGATYTETDLTNDHADGFLVAPNPEGTADILWKFNQPNQLLYTTDGRTVAAGGIQWSSPAYIGDTSQDIINLFLANDKFMVGREDNLYHYDSNGGIHPLMDDLRQARNTRNFQYITYYKGATYFSVGNGVGEITSYDSYNQVSPLQRTDDINKYGYCTGLSSDGDYLYVTMLENTVRHIYKGKQINGEWAWCPWVYLGTTGSSVLSFCQHTTTDRKLWMGYGNQMRYAVVTDNPTADSNARFAYSSYIILSYEYGTNPYWDKMFQSIVTETKGCDADEYISISYRKNTDTSYTSCTGNITTNGVVKTNMTSALTSNRIQFKITFTEPIPIEGGTGAEATPELLLFEARGVEKPETFRVHECVYSVGDTPSRRVSTIKSFLEGGRTSTSLIKFADERFGESVSGTYHYVVMQPGYPQTVEVLHEKERQPELGIKVRWQEVNFT